MTEYFNHRGSTPATDAYYDSMHKMTEAITNRRYDDAAEYVRENLTHISEWVKEIHLQLKHFREPAIPPSIPALEQGGKILALAGDEQGLADMMGVVSSIPELAIRIEHIEQHQRDLHLFQAIYDAILAHPNCLQTSVKGLVNEKDGRRVANLISYLEKAGRIARRKEGRTYRLICTEALEPSTVLPERTVQSHRTGKDLPELHEVDFSTLSYVPLPPAPSQWEENQNGHSRFAIAEAQEQFEVRDSDWRIGSVNSIPIAERPDPAFRRFYPVDSGLLVIDDLGNAEGLGDIEAAALKYDRNGNVSVKAALQHSVYRIGVHPMGKGLIVMSRNCIVHAYRDNLELLFKTALEKSPEIQNLIRRFDVAGTELKNHIRCVALSGAADRYIVTAVDEAYCIDIAGNVLWMTKLPVKDGWNRVATRSSNIGTSSDIECALAVMGLTLPLGPDDLKRRYRELAMQYHPDLNHGDVEAQDRMKAINLATETLTGIEASSVPTYAQPTYYRESERSIIEVEVDGFHFKFSIGMTVGERYASDWIYAASFAAKSDKAYLAGYSGRVVQVDETGRAVRAYDIGAMPRHIVDTGVFLYLLTGTRLYILRDDQLYAVIDTLAGGDLIVAGNGFGLLERKRLRWFNATGEYRGSIVTKQPIRRAYSTRNRLIVETRRQRAVVLGAPTWW